MFCEEDQKHQSPIFARVLLHYEPELDITSSDAVLGAAKRFLTAPMQMEVSYHQGVMEVISGITAGEMELIPIDAAMQRDGVASALGVRAVRKMMLDFIEGAIRLGRGREMVALCPDGLGILADDAKCAQRLKQLLDKAARGGCSLKVITGSACKPESIAPFWGAWMNGHLAGYFTGYHSGSSGMPERIATICVVRDHGALCVANGENGRGISANLYTCKEVIEAHYQRVSACIKDCEQISRQAFLRDPGGYLQDCADYADEPCYLFNRMPQFGFLAPDQYAEFYRIPPNQVEAFERECAPLMHPVREVAASVPVRHVFCLSAIDDTLLEARRMVPALSTFCGQRVFMTAQGLVEALKEIRALLIANKNYEVCFLPDCTFADFSLHVVSWGKRCVVAWNGGKDASATNAPHVAQAAHLFCQKIWERVPNGMRSRAAAIKHIDQWLKKARLYGLEV